MPTAPSPSHSSPEQAYARLRRIGQIGSRLAQFGMIATLILAAGLAIALSFPDLFPPGRYSLDFGFVKIVSPTDSATGLMRSGMIATVVVGGALTFLSLSSARAVFQHLLAQEVFSQKMGQSLRRLGFWALLFALFGQSIFGLLTGLLLVALGSAFTLAAQIKEENSLTV